MDFSSIISDTENSCEQMRNDARNIVQAKIYCAKCEAYCKYLQQNREKAKEFYRIFKEKNDKIFNLSMEILDDAIENANTELAEAAMKTVTTMRNTYPDFYKAYFTQLLRGN